MTEAAEAAAASTAAQVAAQVAVVVAQQTATRDQVVDHEARLRQVETAVVSLGGLPQLVQDLEQRQRADERFRYALPLASIAAAFSAIAAIITAVAAATGKGG
ncbi:hypothetical protein [Nonomuraea rubra]|uniref:hypothetical protein n=1 Tax=Nonomuraea rubra TaxID=46180 RepID=UPI0033EF4A02